MVFQNNLLMGAAGQSDAAHTIDQSCRFDSDTPAYLARTFDTPTNNKIWTLSFWSKICRRDSGGVSIFFGAGDYNGDYNAFYVTPDLKWDDYQSSSWKTQLRSDAVYRDPTAWYHIVYSYDSTPSTPSASSIKIFVNGSQVTSFSTATYPSQNQDSIINSAVATWIGGVPTNGATYYFDGYLAEVVFVDGTALDADSFGETNSTTGQWIPKAISGLTFGNNGFHLDFADSTFLGKDAKATSEAVTNKASTSSEWRGSTGAYTFATNEIDRSSTVNAIMSTDLLSGDFNFNFTMTTSGGAVRIGVFDNKESNTFNGTSDDGGLDSMTNSWYLDKGNDQFRYGGSSQGSASGVANGSAVTIQRTGSTIKITDDGSDVHTFSQTFSNPVRVIIAGGGAAFALDSVQYTADGASGNDNSFFSSGLAAADQMTDSPTDNYATMNPLNKTLYELTDGNLYGGFAFAPQNTRGTAATMAYPRTGKWYWEAKNEVGDQGIWGVRAFDGTQSVDDFATVFNVNSVNAYGIYGGDSGTLYEDGSSSSTGETWGNGDTMGIAFDVDSGKLWFSKNGTWISGDPEDGSSPSATVPSAELANVIYPWGGCGSNTHFQSYDFGQNGFWNAAPSGFSTLSTANFDDPTIADPSAYFQISLYTGNDGSNEIDQTGNSTFEPDMIWLKERSNANSPTIIDAVRGANKGIYPSTTAAEYTETNLSFDADGFSLSVRGSSAQINKTGETYVAWQWLEGVTPGFDIVSYDGTGENRTISHNLGVKPDLMIFKRLDGTQNWPVYHSAVTATGRLILDLNHAEYDDNSFWNDTEPTASVFTLGNDGAANGADQTQIGYLWAGVEGFSKFGSYMGNASTDGPIVWCGFRPAYIFIKSSIGATENWVTHDAQRGPYNVIAPRLELNNNDDEATNIDAVDFLSGGFKLRTDDGMWNGSGDTFVFAAFAETPFKTALAR